MLYDKGMLLFHNFQFSFYFLYLKCNKVNLLQSDVEVYEDLTKHKFSFVKHDINFKFPFINNYHFKAVQPNRGRLLGIFLRHFNYLISKAK